MKITIFLKTLLYFFLFTISIPIVAQNYTPFQYRFILRDNSGLVVSNRALGIQLTIFEGNDFRNIIYKETQNVTSETGGMVNLKIGSGNSEFSFNEIVWKLSAQYFIRIELNTTENDNFSFNHEAQILLMPNGIVAGTVNDFADIYANNLNARKLEALSYEGNRLYLSNGGYVEIPDRLIRTNSILIEANKTNVTCKGLTDGTIDINVTGGTPPYTYTWSNGRTSEDLNNLAAGIYEIYIEDSEGYTALKKINIFEPDSLMVRAQITNVSDIGKNDGQIILSPFSSDFPYSYEWSNGSNKSSLKNITPGEYTVKISSSENCFIRKKFVVQEPIQINKQKRDIFCYGMNNGEIYLDIAGGKPPYQLLWSNKQNGNHLKNLSAGVYYFSIVDQWGYSVIDSITINQPKPIQANPVVQNINDDNPKGTIKLNTTGGVGPYTYSWSTGDSTNTISNLNDGRYAVTITDKYNCKIQEPFIYVYKLMLDERDSTEYRVITIGNQEWMADNLNYGTFTQSFQESNNDRTIQKYCYNNNTEYCDVFGGLYSWEEAMDYSRSDDGTYGVIQGICPDGWHIPTDTEWKNLVDELGGEIIAGDLMKDFSYWPKPSNLLELDLSGFSAFPAGRMDRTGEFYQVGNSTSFWSSTKDQGNNIWHRTLTGRSSSINRTSSHFTFRFSVRCVKDRKKR